MKALLVGVLTLSFPAVFAEPALDQFVVEVNLRGTIGDLPSHPIGLHAALNEALGQSLDLALARADEQIARESRYTADAALYPALAVGFFARRLDGRVQGSFGALRDVAYSTYTARAALVYRANIAARLKQALAERQSVQGAEFDRLDTEQRLLLHVVEMYQDLLLSGVAVQIARDVVSLSEQFINVVQARTEGGLALGADVARAQAKLAVDRQDLVRARNLLIHASTRLAVVLRRDVDVVLLPIDAHLTAASYARPASLDSQARPDVQAAGRRSGAAERQVSSAKWDLYFPELWANLGHVQLGDTIDDLEGRDERAGLLLWNLSPVVFGHIRQRKAEQHRARLELAQVEDRAAGEIRRAEQDLTAARDRIPLAGDGFRAAADTLRLSEARFRAGTAIALEVFDAQDVLAQARFNLAAAIVDYNSAQARLLAASGTIERASFGISPAP
jgi:multidrug efflux system outer membrane protein